MGRTGSGKSAILDFIKRTEANVATVDPESVSLNFISNSNVIQFFHSIDVDLTLFYQLLWQHVVCSEIIRVFFNISDEKAQEKFYRLVDTALRGDRTKQQAFEYLQEWQDKFWIDFDLRLQEITSSFEKSLGATVSADLKVVEFGASAADGLSKKERVEIQSRARKVVNEIQIQELSRVIEALSDLLDKRMGDHFVTIDGLDVNWVHESIRYKLIGGLIEGLKKFGKIKNLKVIVALRDDVYERVKIETKDPGFQSEKSEGLIVRLKWHDHDLMDLLDARISFLYKSRYTKDKIGYSEVFPEKVRGQKTSKYLLDRTMRRPRDLIAFINEILDHADGKTEVIASTISDAEAAYSKKRIEALEEEWVSVHPNLRYFINCLAGQTATTSIDQLAVKELLDELVLQVDPTFFPSDDTTKIAEKLLSKQTASGYIRLSKSLLVCLFKVGVVALKQSSSDRFAFSYESMGGFSEPIVETKTAFKIHPMTWRALSVSDRS